jgi:hypothetical protein
MRIAITAAGLLAALSLAACGGDKKVEATPGATAAPTPTATAAAHTAAPAKPAGGGW